MSEMKKVTEKEFFDFIWKIEHLRTRSAGNFPYTFECRINGELIAKAKSNDYFIKK